MAIFTDEQMQQLILIYLSSRPDQTAYAGEIEKFLKACEKSVVEGEAIRMAADGMIDMQWDAQTDAFAFRAKQGGDAGKGET